MSFAFSRAMPNIIGFSNPWRNGMTKSKLLTAGLIAAAMLASPVVAQENHPGARYHARAADVGALSGAPYIDGRVCVPAPRVGAFAGQPWENDVPCEPMATY
jgi:hypothetical protein